MSEVNSEISPQCNVRINGVCVYEEFLQTFSHEGGLLRTRSFRPGFLGQTLRRLFVVKEVGGERVETLPIAAPNFRAVLLLKKIIEDDEMKSTKA